MRPVLPVLLYAIASAVVASYAQGGKTYCNPLDLNYQYNFEQRERNISYRSGADPVLLSHKGEYYLFGTIAGGYWHSKNLRDWRHVKPTGWPARDTVAPAALSAKGKLFLFGPEILHRGQPHGTFKLFFNGIYLAGATPLGDSAAGPGTN